MEVLVPKTNSLGILGGTFDPIHYGHLIAAEYARDEFNLERIYIVPAAAPPHKDLAVITDEKHRVAMVSLAIADNPDLELSTLELDRGGISYTVDTVSCFKERYRDSEINLIIGADCLSTLNTWKDINRLVYLVDRFIVVTRPGYEKSQPVMELLPENIWDRMEFIQIPGFDLSSSEIRERVARGRAIRYLVPEPVADYIYDHGLYARKE
jgi:nicotinate-nucleotide adenylyltransferase